MFMQPQSAPASPLHGPGHLVENFRERTFAHHRQIWQGLAAVSALAAEKLVIGDLVGEAAILISNSSLEVDRQTCDRNISNELSCDVYTILQ
jgi:hypothetical protein